jgi:hypothetical protein
VLAGLVRVEEEALRRRWREAAPLVVVQQVLAFLTQAVVLARIRPEHLAAIANNSHFIFSQI